VLQLELKEPGSKKKAFMFQALSEHTFLIMLAVTGESHSAKGHSTKSFFQQKVIYLKTIFKESFD
jgi:hypothetical protein